MKNFTLVNPYIKGTFDTNFKSKTELDAAQKAWSSLGKNITQNLPKYCFTLERGTDKKLFHFSVKEEINDGLVDYKLGSFKISAKSKKLKSFKSKLSQLKKADKQHQSGIVIIMFFLKSIKNILNVLGGHIPYHGIGTIL